MVPYRRWKIKNIFEIFYCFTIERAKMHFRRKLCDVFEEDVLIERQCQNWFAKFRSGNFNLEDALRPGRPLEAVVDKIKSLVDANRRITTREIAERLNLSNATIHKHMKRVELISKLDIWVPVITDRNLLRSTNNCDTLIRRQRNDPF